MEKAGDNVETVTIAINMLGHGTDIKLSKGVIKNGGLAVLGTERDGSRITDICPGRPINGRNIF